MGGGEGAVYYIYAAMTRLPYETGRLTHAAGRCCPSARRCCATCPPTRLACGASGAPCTDSLAPSPAPPGRRGGAHVRQCGVHVRLRTLSVAPLFLCTPELPLGNSLCSESSCVRDFFAFVSSLWSRQLAPPSTADNGCPRVTTRARAYTHIAQTSLDCCVAGWGDSAEGGLDWGVGRRAVWAKAEAGARAGSKRMGRGPGLKTSSQAVSSS